MQDTRVHHPKTFPDALCEKSHLFLNHLQSQPLLNSITILLVNFYPRTTYKWSDMISVLLCLASFAQNNGFEIHPLSNIHKQWIVMWIYHNLFSNFHWVPDILDISSFELLNKTAVSNLVQIFSWTYDFSSLAMKLEYWAIVMFYFIGTTKYFPKVIVSFNIPTNIVFYSCCIASSIFASFLKMQITFIGMQWYHILLSIISW